MAFTNIQESDLGGGIDQLSPESKLTPGYAEDILNMDPTPEGSLAKRPGYEQYGGWVPVRVESITYSTDSTDNICFYLDDDSVNLALLRGQPILVTGRTSTSHSGDFTNTNSTHWYSTFSSDERRTFLAGSNTESGIAAFSTPYSWVLTSSSTTPTDLSNSQFLLDNYEVDQATGNLSISYTSASAFDGWLISIDRSPVGGSVFWGSDGGSLVTKSITASSTTTFTIPSATHQLNSLNISAQVFHDTGSVYRAIEVDSITVEADGDVRVSVTNNTLSAFNAIVSLAVNTSTNTISGTVGAMSSDSITITSPDTAFAQVAVWLEDIGAGEKTLVYPDSVVYDATLNTITVNFTNNSSSSANFMLYWDFYEPLSNRLCVTGAVIGTGYTDSSPQLTIWGLDHRLLYSSSASRPGWLTHLDTWKSEGEEQIICALGGNLFSLEDSVLVTKFPTLRSRVLSASITAPLFQESSSSRTRGYLQFTGAASGWGDVQSFTWNSGTSRVDIVISAPSLSVQGTLANMVTLGTDQITIQGAGYSIHNGTFSIETISTSSSTITISVENSSVIDSDWDETDSGAQAGVFTDKLNLTGTLTFAAGDRILSSLFGDESYYTAVKASSASLWVSGVSGELDWPMGLRVVGERTSRVIPLADAAGTSDVTDVVPGDNIALSDREDLFHVAHMNSSTNISVTVATTGIVTLLSGNTSNYYVNQRIFLVQGGELDGEYSVTSVPSSTTLECEGLSGLSGSAILLGKTIELEDSITWSDPVTGDIEVTVPRRWSVVEHPDDSWELTPFNQQFYFDSQDYAAQSTIRSVEVAGNLYLTNGSDSVQKYDGTSIYRAGLPRWQPQLFAAVDSAPSSGGSIAVIPPSATTTAVVSTSFQLTLGEEQRFSVGDNIRQSFTGGYNDYVVTNVYDNGTNGFVAVATNVALSIGAGTNTLRVLSAYSYYMRLSLVDANGNLVQSATTGLGDTVVMLSGSSQVRLKLISMPTWDIFDYDRVEVEIFRTKKSGIAPYYKLANVSLSFDKFQGYFTYVDSDADDVLVDLDSVAAELTGGTGGGRTWSQPLRAYYTTTLGNSLVLANLKDYPKLDVRLVDTVGRITIAELVTGTTANNRWLLRRLNTDTLTTTDNLNRVAVEFVSAFTGNITAISFTASTFTATASVAHGLSTGSWVYMTRNDLIDGMNLTYAGWWQVASVSGMDFTVNAEGNSAWSSTSGVTRFVRATAPADLPVFLGTDGAYQQTTANRSDAVFSYENIAVRRWAAALNAHQRLTDTTLSGQSAFRPWLLANAGAEYAYGQIVLENPLDSTNFLELTIPAHTGFSVFVNSVITPSTATDRQAEIAVYPSRLLVSFSNYPEVFDSPTTTRDVDSLSAIDVNPADGQQITGVIPFFGDSAFSAALRDTMLVVFKTNSVYLVNLAAKKAGQEAVQKIESYGLGCTAPYSIAPTRDGIMFANDSGLYKINRNLQVVYSGRKLQRIWRENAQLISLAQGHFWAGGSKYKLSCNLSTDTDADSRNEDVLVYDTTREYTPDGFRDGSWTKYDSHNATAWCNLGNSEFWGTTDGRLFRTRQPTDVRPWRDDTAAISASATLRAMDFGDAGLRKQGAAVLLQWRVLATAETVTVSAAVNLTEDFQELDASVVRNSTTAVDGLSTLPGTKLKTIAYALPTGKFEQLQLQVGDSNIDSPMELAGVVYRVRGLSEKGITMAAETE